MKMQKYMQKKAVKAKDNNIWIPQLNSLIFHKSGVKEIELPLELYYSQDCSP